LKKKKRIEKQKAFKSKLGQAILNILQVSSQNLNYKQIASKLELKTKAEKHIILELLDFLEKENKIKETSRGKYTSLKENLKINFTGTLDVSSNGNAYFITEDLEKDVFIHASNINRALNNDTVKVYIFKRKKMASKKVK